MTISLSKYDREQLFREFEEFLSQKKPEISIPLSIFSKSLSPFETVVKYLVENSHLKYSKIGELLHKDRQVIWTTYKRAAKKCPELFQASDEKNSVPVASLVSDKFSIAECLVGYLIENRNLKNSEVADLLKKDARTTWTFYKRYQDKKNE